MVDVHSQEDGCKKKLDGNRHPNDVHPSVQKNQDRIEPRSDAGEPEGGRSVCVKNHAEVREPCGKQEAEVRQNRESPLVVQPCRPLQADHQDEAQYDCMDKSFPFHGGSI